MVRGGFDHPREALEQGWDEHAPMICPKSGEACVRAFCEDYGCADKAGVPIDANDMACGVHPSRRTDYALATSAAARSIGVCPIALVRSILKAQ